MTSRLNKILVPIDFSAASSAAVSHAGALARRFHSELTLLHVNEFLVVHPLSGPLGFGITSWEALSAEHLEARQKQLEEFGATELQGVEVKRMIRGGDPAKVIAACAREQHSDLVLMPTRGEGAFRRFLFGSVTAKVLHDAECPVWTGVHLAEPPPYTPDDIRHVMCAVDFGPRTPEVLHWAAALAADFQATLTAVHVGLGTPPGLSAQSAFEWHEQAHSGAEEQLRAAVLDADVQADLLVTADGGVPQALAAAASEKGAGLLVIGRSSGGAASKGLGHRTYAIVCGAPCPVVSI